MEFEYTTIHDQKFVNRSDKNSKELGNLNNKSIVICFKTKNKLEINDVLNLILILIYEPNNNLENLHLTGTKMNDEDIQRFVNVLIHPNNKLKRLDIGFNEYITDKGVWAFITSFNNPNNKIVSLGIGGSMITVEIERELKKVINKTNNRLKHLYIHSSSIIN